MEKKDIISKFIKQKIQEIDQLPSSSQNDQVEKLKAATKRTTYAKILETFILDDSQTMNSHYKQAQLYLQIGKTEQAISHVQKAKRKLLKNTTNETKDQAQNQQFLQNINLLLIQCYIKSKKCQDALTLIEQIDIKTEVNIQKYLNLQGKIYQTLKNYSKSQEIYQKLHKLLVKQYGAASTKEGLCLIEMGKSQGFFQNYPKGISLINKGMSYLIENRYNNPVHVSKIYETLAEFNRQINDYEKQHCALICAYSMIRQLEENQQKRTVAILIKLAKNLQNKDEKHKALEQLYKVEELEKKMYGQIGGNLTKTVKKIISLLYELEKQSQARKYQVEYQHLIGTNTVGQGSSQGSPLKKNNNISNSRTSAISANISTNKASRVRKSPSPLLQNSSSVSNNSVTTIKNINNNNNRMIYDSIV